MEFRITRRMAIPLVALGGWATSAAVAVERAIRLILPVSPSSAVDISARAAQEELGKALGQPVIVEDMPGAGGLIGTATLTKADPDGMTLGMVSVNHVIYPSLYKSMPFDPIRDVTPISILGGAPLVIVVHPAVKATNAKELVALMNEKRGQVNFGSSGNGTQLHLVAELFLRETGAKANHIPYKGVGPMLTDLMGRQFEWCVSALPTVQQYLSTGALRAIGVASTKRILTASSIPTFVEQGMPRFVAEGWMAMVGPKGLPDRQVRRIYAAAMTAFHAPRVREVMTNLGSVPILNNPEEAARFLRNERDRYAKLAKDIGLQPG